MAAFVPIKRILLLLALATLGGCLSNMIYLRTDGQNIAGDPALRQQFDLDRAFCQAKLQVGKFF